ncbi:MAG: DUF2125 domain-containing protein [Gemmobacter sp.]
MFRRQLLCLSSLVAMCAAAPAVAQVTPEQVWDNWRSILDTAGYQVTVAGETRSGDTLTLSGVLLQMAAEGNRATVPLGTVRMRDRGDGSVEITMDPEYRIDMRTENPDQDPVEMTLSLRQPGLGMIASGRPGAMRYDYTAPEFRVELERMTVKDEAVPMTFVVEMGGLSGFYMSGGADGRDLSASVRTDRADVELEATNPEGAGRVAVAIQMEAIAGDFSGRLIENLGAYQELSGAFAAGFRMEGDYGAGRTQFSIDAEEAQGQTAIRGEIAETTVGIGMNADRLRYKVGAKGLDLTLSGDTIPVPEINVTAAEYGIGILLPVAETGEPADFEALLRVVDLALPDDIWGMFDPMGAMPRDPATLILDARGKLLVLADLFSPETAQSGAPPFAVEAVDLTELRVKAIGAELTGAGAFTFDNDDLETFDGMPRPTGAVDLTLVGGNALIDRLVSMGMLPQDQAMGARMMMGLFGRPGAGEDTLTSRIEVTPDGAVLANGQRIQ